MEHSSAERRGLLQAPDQKEGDYKPSQIHVYGATTTTHLSLDWKDSSATAATAALSVFVERESYKQDTMPTTKRKPLLMVAFLLLAVVLVPISFVIFSRTRGFFSSPSQHYLSIDSMLARVVQQQPQPHQATPSTATFCFLILYRIYGTFLSFFDDTSYLVQDEKDHKEKVVERSSSRPTLKDKRYQCRATTAASTIKTVRQGKSSFASYLDYSHPSHPKSIDVTYDARSIRLNDTPTILVGGSMHPVRATKTTWNDVLNLAVESNLNLITLYVMWNYHQPSSNEPINWKLPGGDWTLSDAIWEAACRGLFVHVRIGPYVCAEYSYGGIPEWVPWMYGRTVGGDDDNSTMSLRRPNKAWYKAMKLWVDACVTYLTNEGLWANQGGPIILGQIENELGGDVDPSVDILDAGSTLQDYANWCGKIATQAQPNVVWTMCNGLSSNQTVNTCNGYGTDGACSTTWLEEHGQNHLIQITQPPMWTEQEMGFQLWGDSPSRPSDYFWGRTAKSTARDTLQWLARGGTHLNYYMFWGGYNRPMNSAAGGIINSYSTDALVCSNTQPRQPKFDHLSKLHKVIVSISNSLVLSPTALDRPIHLEYHKSHDNKHKDQSWQRGTQQLAFGYGCKKDIDNDPMGFYNPSDCSILFIENNSNDNVIVRVPRISDNSSTTTGLRTNMIQSSNRQTHSFYATFTKKDAGGGVNEMNNFSNNSNNSSSEDFVVLQMKPWEVLILNASHTGNNISWEDLVPFRSSDIDTKALSYQRTIETLSPDSMQQLHDWSSWDEPIPSYNKDVVRLGSTSHSNVVKDNKPWELTKLLYYTNSSSSEYVWYTTHFSTRSSILLPNENNNRSGLYYNLVVETQKASALSVFVDGMHMGEINNHEHSNGNITFHLKLQLPAVPRRIDGFVETQPTYHQLSILYESFGFGNIVGRWGVPSSPITKGITGNVWLVQVAEEDDDKGDQGIAKYPFTKNAKLFSDNNHGTSTNHTICLACENHTWYSSVGLNGKDSKSSSTKTIAAAKTMTRPATWWSATFATPKFSSTERVLLLQTTIGRGHLWVNGHSLGRYWNITHSSSTAETKSNEEEHSYYSQSYYHIPMDFLVPSSDGTNNRNIHDVPKLNELLIFNVLGGDIRNLTRLILTSLEATNSPNFQDEVGYQDACLY